MSEKVEPPREIGLVQGPFGFRLWSRESDNEADATCRYIHRADYDALKAENDRLREALRRLEVISHSDEECWLHLRPDSGLGHGLVSIHITEKPMVAAYKHWASQLAPHRALTKPAEAITAALSEHEGRGE